jgi:hypothetical protein
LKLAIRVGVSEKTILAFEAGDQWSAADVPQFGSNPQASSSSTVASCGAAVRLRKAVPG